MVKLIFLSLFISLIAATNWHYNMQEAKEIAQKEHKYILLNFSGSDWCGPCMRLHDEIFESNVFKQMADTQLVLVNADFPRKKKNQLSAEQQELNNKMAEQYNSRGKFPYTLLLDANGKVLKEWDGLPNENADNFTIEVRNGIYANR
jgi:thioredoxin-related protein